jgi:hypothetical protein
MKEVVIINGMDMVPRPRPRRGVARIELSREPVHVRGEELGEVWWRGHQWAVTAHGIECLDGTYPIAAHRLLDERDGAYNWPEQAGKIWVDVDEFATAWMIAILLHGYGGKVDAERMRRGFTRLRPSREIER